jgi:hypothetical protein
VRVSLPLCLAYWRPLFPRESIRLLYSFWWCSDYTDGDRVYDVCAEKKCLNSELWHACAGPLVCLPTVGTRVVYFPQGHSEQVSGERSSS